MVKSEIIFAVIALVVSIILPIIPLGSCCLFFLVIILGAAAGYVAGNFDKPADTGAAAGKGAAAGAIAGIGALVGAPIGYIISNAISGPAAQQMISNLMEQSGINYNSAMSGSPLLSGVVGGCCCGVVDILLMAGLGALGGMLWSQIGGKKTAPPPPTSVIS